MLSGVGERPGATVGRMSRKPDGERARDKVVSVRMTTEERAETAAKAATRSLDASAYLRTLMKEDRHDQS